MSTLFVDTINEKTTGNGIIIPGHVIQVVQYFNKGISGANKTPLASLTTSTFTDIMSQSITTKQANSKILVHLHTVAYNSSNVLRGKTKVLRDSTEIDADQYGFYTAAASHMQNFISTVLDAPAASAGTSLTYKLQVGNVGGGTLTVGYGDVNGGATSSITLMEIAQ